MAGGTKRLPRAVREQQMLDAAVDVFSDNGFHETSMDSIAKKARFLEAVRDELGLRDRVSVVCGRVETLPTLGVQVATARAAAPLDKLFDWALRHVRPGGLYVFPKGRRWAEEVEEAQTRFLFDFETRDSLTDAEAKILLVRNLKRL